MSARKIKGFRYREAENEMSLWYMLPPRRESNVN